MALHITGHDSIYLCTIIKEGCTALPIDLHLGYIFDPVPMLEGIRIQEGSLLMLSYTWGTTSMAAFGVVPFIGGVQAPFFGAVPSLQFKGNFAPNAFTKGQLQMKCSKLIQ